MVNPVDITNNKDFFNSFKDLIFPAFVALLTAFFSYFATYRLNKKSQDDAFNRGRITFIDSLLTEVNKLMSLLDKLTNDVEEKGYFWIKNLNSIKPSINKLTNLSDSAVYYEEGDVRTKIIQGLNSAVSLIEEIDSTERYPVNEQLKIEQIAQDTLKDIRTMKFELIKMGFFIDDKFEVKAFGGSKKKISAIDQEKADVIKKLIPDLFAFHTSNKEKLDKIVNKENPEKRTYFTMRILDLQGKLREITNLLTNEKTALLR